MKKTFVVAIALLFFANLASSQIYIDGKELRQDITQYIEIQFTGVVGSQDVRMFIDYGQNVGFLDRRNRIVSDNRGKALIFNSSIHGLNYMYQEGYELFNVFSPQVGGNNVNVDVRYILKKIRKAE